MWNIIKSFLKKKSKKKDTILDIQLYNNYKVIHNNSKIIHNNNNIIKPIHNAIIYLPNYNVYKILKQPEFISNLKLESRKKLDDYTYELNILKNIKQNSIIDIKIINKTLQTFQDETFRKDSKAYIDLMYLMEIWVFDRLYDEFTHVYDIKKEDEMIIIDKDILRICIAKIDPIKYVRSRSLMTTVHEFSKRLLDSKTPFITYYEFILIKSFITQCSNAPAEGLDAMIADTSVIKRMIDR